MEFNKFLIYKYILFKIIYYIFMNFGEKKKYGYIGLSLLRKIIRVGLYYLRFSGIGRKLKVGGIIENFDKRKKKKKKI